ncbi:5'-methylthioadenosine/S-adenosylhomocysteine nucleosidase [Listeria fleischmannii subsp. fleischmannii]|uniref:5'-methylthioadenosine/S-adenosylhomocysteine nucleosidase n=1 Tax=Listeria fleischmannii subsp. fleischmannii TaxID=1671902 RepID=A0A2X3HBG3_9LIST|nr:5'-methylthioadenosine/S-adenosylhomocysteine nucleosidase [Listeria fleischmannii subsp. fleischmannii]
MIGIIGAMEEEVKILKEQMTLLLEEEIAGAKFYRGTLEIMKLSYCNQVSAK